MYSLYNSQGYFGVITMRYHYPLLKPKHLVPRKRMRLLPKAELDPLTRAELSNLRRGIKYVAVGVDSPENRESINLKLIYFQQVAYKEGWTFDPENYQVHFVPASEYPLQGTDIEHARIYRSSAAPAVGFRVDGDSATRMQEDTVLDLEKRLMELQK